MRRALVAVVAAGAIMAMGACGDSSDKAAKATTTTVSACDLGKTLKADVQKLKDVNVLKDGTNAMQPAIDAIQKDAQELAAAGKTSLQPKVDELKSALTGLSDSLKEVSANGLGPVSSAAESVTAAADNLSKEIDSLKCD